jgi:glc operon protein GlcG
MKATLLFLLTFITFCLAAQNQPSTAPAAIPMYGESITLEKAKKLVAAAEAFAVGKQWPIAVAIVDTGGNLVMLVTMDNTQRASIDIAIGKAKTANNFKRPTKALEDVIAGGGSGLRILAVPGLFPIEGGEPIYANGKIVGAIGVSGMSAVQDEEVVKAALAGQK